MSVSCDPGNYAKKKNFRSQFGKMASTSYSAVEVLDLLDTDFSDSGSSGGGPVSGLVDQTPQLWY